MEFKQIDFIRLKPLEYNIRNFVDQYLKLKINFTILICFFYIGTITIIDGGFTISNLISGNDTTSYYILILCDLIRLIYFAICFLMGKVFPKINSLMVASFPLINSIVITELLFVNNDFISFIIRAFSSGSIFMFLLPFYLFFFQEENGI